MYSLDQVPSWCYMHPNEHQACGGCWGISYGNVARDGEKHCLTCEYHVNNVIAPTAIVEAKNV